MTIILDNYTLPEKGPVTVNVSFEIKVTAEEARRKVIRWLIDEVSYLLGADPPALVVSERAVWRVPAYISFPHTGRLGDVGKVDVDVETGEMRDPSKSKAEIERCLEENIKPLVPPYQKGTRHVPPEHLVRASTISDPGADNG